MSMRRKHPPEFKAKVVMEIPSGEMTTLEAWMLLCRLEASVPTLGVGLTLNVVAAAVIGGVSLKGGECSIIGAFAGVLFLAMVNNALNLMNVDPLWVNAVRGLIILVALIIDAQKVALPRSCRTLHSQSESQGRAQAKRGALLNHRRAAAAKRATALTQKQTFCTCEHRG